MDELKPNSRKSRENAVPEKKVEKVVTGAVVTKKKSEIHKFTDIFVSEDIDNVKSYIFLDVLMPAIKTTIVDIVTNGLDMLLYGESSRKRSNGRPIADRISYNRISDSSYRQTRQSVERRSSGYGYDDIVLDDRGDAEEVLDRMCELIETYGEASVADLYDLVGISCRHTDNKYGWTDLSRASVVRSRSGYLLKMPRAYPLD